MPIGKNKDGESSGDDYKKRTASPFDNDTDSQDGGRRSKRKKARVSWFCVLAMFFFFQPYLPE